MPDTRQGLPATCPAGFAHRDITGEVIARNRWKILVSGGAPFPARMEWSVQQLQQVHSELR